MSLAPRSKARTDADYTHGCLRRLDATGREQNIYTIRWKTGRDERRPSSFRSLYSRKKGALQSQPLAAGNVNPAAGSFFCQTDGRRTCESMNARIVRNGWSDDFVMMNIFDVMRGGS